MDFVTYAQSHQTKICLETGRVRSLLKKCSSPDKSFKIIHVTGTNGKGSVCSYLCEGLMLMGKKTGKFSSPELFDITDTITVNNTPISQTELASIYEFLEPLSKEVEIEEGKALSQFEINFVAALLHFKNSGCTHAVIECGMGGLGDATNAIGSSDICVLTKISLDHESYLGDTLEKITANKCGIIKENSVVFTTAKNSGVMGTIKTFAPKERLFVADIPRCQTDGMHALFPLGSSFVRLSLCGIHQAENAALAAKVLSFLGADEPCLKKALSSAKNPARLEEIEKNVYFDGAHNPDGAAALIDSINASGIDGKMVFVTGFMADKDYHTSLTLLKNLKNQNFEIYTVPVLTNPRSETVSKLADCVRSLGFSAKEFPNVKSAIAEGKKHGDALFIFGSLYLYKEVIK